MSKERLEIIKFLRNSEKTVAPGMQPSDLISRKDVDWLIQQAERVEELEEEVDRLNGALHYQLSQENIRNEENRKLKYKNKRYREALEKIKQKGELMNYSTGRESYNGQAEIARKALECEE